MTYTVSSGTLNPTPPPTLSVSLPFSPKFGLSLNKRATSLFGLTFAQSKFWTERKTEQKTNPKSEIAHWTSFKHSLLEEEEVEKEEEGEEDSK